AWFLVSHVDPDTGNGFVLRRIYFMKRGFITHDVEEKALEFDSLLQEIHWGPLVKDP
ncbi:hypothetical protein HAX54_014247, partial [Datura stramonium]|nr:hypothetical protein [Datura stramonium]